MPRFTVTGDDSLDARIEAQLTEVADALWARLPADRLRALVLGGGYGRGEGGALWTEDGLRPYNDYDLVLVHEVGNEEALRAVLQEVHHTFTARFGIHVDVMPLRAGQLPKLPPTLTWYELADGHRVVRGEAHVIEAMGPRTLQQLPPSEWGRLLFNRGCGLLFATWALQGKHTGVMADEDFEAFTTRQVQKAWLTLGDVLLADRRQYRPRVLRRREAFEALGDDAPPWAAHYLRAVDFKLSPVLRRPRAALIEELGSLDALFADALRTHEAAEARPLVGTYATLRHLSPLRWGLSRPWRYPRERLRRALAAELVGDTLVRERLVGSPDDYVRLWEQYA